MKRLMVRTGFVLLVLSTKSLAQSGPVTPPTDTVRAPQASCVILKRMGRLDRTKSRLPSLGISGKQFRYIEGKLPEGFSLHQKMTGHDVRNLQARGAQVLVLDSDYKSEDLQEARATCSGQTGKAPNQVEAKAALPAASTSASATNPPVARPPAAKASTRDAKDSSSSAGTTVAALIDVSSTPTGADVYIDDRFFGRTPSTTIILEPGDHRIAIKKDGFVIWKKKLKLSSGPSNVDAQLLPKAK